MRDQDDCTFDWDRLDDLGSDDVQRYADNLLETYHAVDCDWTPAEGLRAARALLSLAERYGLDEEEIRVPLRRLVEEVFP